MSLRTEIFMWSLIAVEYALFAALGMYNPYSWVLAACVVVIVFRDWWKKCQ